MKYTIGDIIISSRKQYKCVHELRPVHTHSIYGDF